MNRENKRKTFEKDYYKTHACSDTFVCKVCGPSSRKTPALTTGTIAPIASRACMSILTPATARPTAAGSWNPWPSG